MAKKKFPRRMFVTICDYDETDPIYTSVSTVGDVDEDFAVDEGVAVYVLEGVGVLKRSKKEIHLPSGEILKEEEANGKRKAI